MATKYVNKSGNDSNDGSTTALAKLTIQAAVNAASSGDSIVVGSGFYNEKITLVAGRTIALYADGVVVVDGSGLSVGYLVTHGSGAGANSVAFDKLSTGGWWIFQNVNGSRIVSLETGSSSSASMKNCIFRYSGGNTNGYYSNSQFSATIQNCVFDGAFTYAINVAYGVTGACSFLFNTIYGATTGINMSNTGSAPVTIANNIISNCTTAWNITTAVATNNLNFNHFYTITNWKYVSNTYTSLSLTQAAGWELNSVSADPQFIDTSKGIYYLKAESSVSRKIGAYPFGYTRGQNYDPQSNWDVYSSSPDNTKWYSADGNVGKNGTTGFLELIGGTSAVVDSPVYDLGSVQAVKQINIFADQVWGTNMIDTTKTDTKPNYQTVEIRGSGSSFDQDDAVISWTEVKSNIPISAISGRYIQLRLTFRADDVSA